MSSASAQPRSGSWNTPAPSLFPRCFPPPSVRRVTRCRQSRRHALRQAQDGRSRTRSCPLMVSLSNHGCVLHDPAHGLPNHRESCTQNLSSLLRILTSSTPSLLRRRFYLSSEAVKGHTIRRQRAPANTVGREEPIPIRQDSHPAWSADSCGSRGHSHTTRTQQ